MMEQKRTRAVAAAGAVMYALFAAFGYQMDHFEQSRPLHAAAAAALLFIPAYLILRFLLSRSARRRLTPETGGAFSFGKAFAGILLCYVPMLLITFPGSFAYDVPFQLKQVFTGEYLTSHPLLHTLLLGGCVALGRALGNINAGAALYSLVQMTAMAALFAAACASIARQSSVRAAKLSAVFFAAYPLHMMYAVNATKDVLFGGLFVLCAALVREALVLNKTDRRFMAAISLCAAGMMLMRSNAILAVVLWMIPAVLLLGKQHWKVITAIIISVVIYAGGGLHPQNDHQCTGRQPEGAAVLADSADGSREAVSRRSADAGGNAGDRRADAGRGLAAV